MDWLDDDASERELALDERFASLAAAVEERFTSVQALASVMLKAVKETAARRQADNILLTSLVRHIATDKTLTALLLKDLHFASRPLLDGKGDDPAFNQDVAMLLWQHIKILDPAINQRARSKPSNRGEL